MDSRDHSETSDTETEPEGPRLPDREYAEEPPYAGVVKAKPRTNHGADQHISYANTGEERPRKGPSGGARVNMGYVPDEPVATVSRTHPGGTTGQQARNNQTQKENAYEDLPDFKGRNNPAKRAMPPTPRPDPMSHNRPPGHDVTPEGVQEEYYNTIADPEGVTIATVTNTNKHTVSIEGRFIYPFLDAKWQYLVADDGSNKEVKMDKLADSVSDVLRTGIREFYGALRLILDFFFILAVETFRFTARHVVQGLVIRLLAVVGDFMLKPLLSTLFNSFIMPVMTFAWNVLDITRGVMRPVLSLSAELLDMVGRLLSSFRLVEINKTVDRAHIDTV